MTEKWRDGDWGVRGSDEEIRAALRHVAEVRQRREPLFDGEITEPREALRWLADIEVVHEAAEP